MKAVEVVCFERGIRVDGDEGRLENGVLLQMSPFSSLTGSSASKKEGHVREGRREREHRPCSQPLWPSRFSTFSLFFSCQKGVVIIIWTGEGCSA